GDGEAVAQKVAQTYCPVRPAQHIYLDVGEADPIELRFIQIHDADPLPGYCPLVLCPCPAEPLLADTQMPGHLPDEVMGIPVSLLYLYDQVPSPFIAEVLEDLHHQKVLGISSDYTSTARTVGDVVVHAQKSVLLAC